MVAAMSDERITQRVVREPEISDSVGRTGGTASFGREPAVGQMFRPACSQ